MRQSREAVTEKMNRRKSKTRKLPKMAEDSFTVHLTITAEQGSPRLPLTVHKTITSNELRVKISETTKIPSDALKMIYRGRMIVNDESKAVADEYKLEDGSVIHCMGKPVKADAAAAAPSEAAATASPPVPAPLPTMTTAEAPPAPAAAPVTPVDPLQAALQQLRASNSSSVYQTAVTTLGKVLSNITDNPMAEKYRKVKTKNAAFQRRLGGVAGGDTAMKACGFVREMVDGEEHYVMKASAEAWPKLMACKAAVDTAVRDANAVANQASAPPAASFGASMSGGLPGMPLGGAAGFPPGSNDALNNLMSNPAQMQAMNNLLSNPAQMQAMLQNPMVQQMMRNDPRVANNPGMLQALQQAANNPALAQQMTQMMNNPAMRAQLQSMMAGSGGGMGMPPGPTIPQQSIGSGQPPPGNSNRNNNSSSSSENDGQQTEEEMIAEAIRRSLEES